MIKLTVAQYEEMFGDSIADVQVCENKEAVAAYVSENEECPYTGVEYADGTFSICGVGSDNVVTKEEMEWMLHQC